MLLGTIEKTNKGFVFSIAFGDTEIPVEGNYKVEGMPLMNQVERARLLR